MIERIGKDIVVNGDILPGADYYDGIDQTEDGPVIDKIISGIDSHPLEHSARSREQYDATILAQGVLFLIDQDERSKSVRASVEQHPSAQNISPQKLSTIAGDIIAAYEEEVQRLEHYKNRVNSSSAARSAFIAVVRNLDRLSTYDREEIAVALGHHKDYFTDHHAPTSTSAGEPRERDWRERQANDDTLKDD